ncbi:MAG: class I SAM-dependent DNA methyltransferase, partial [Chloroflexi bacterium]|nr:class I SAM-dependent DNA methyltransferase [Chloroflexota bacterium]
MPPTMTPQQFVAKWRPSALKESAASQEHFIDVCRLIGHPTPAAADPSGSHFTFEAGATKATGGQGFADVWKRDYFAWEYKGPGGDLDIAYGQLLKYRESLLNPPLLVVSDIAKIVIHTNFTNTVKRVETLTLDDLLEPAGRALLRAVFFSPEDLRAPQTPQQATQEAAAKFARIAEILRKYGEEPRVVAHYLIRLLFCLFAEDIGLLPDRIFSTLVQATRRTPKDFVAQVEDLFAKMASGGYFGASRIPHIDGSLFDGAEVLEADTDVMDSLAEACELDWSSIDPAILGTLFERSLDPDKRSQLGAHYTSRDDIALIVEPVLMAPLRRRWEAIKEQASPLVDGAHSNTPQERKAAAKRLRAVLAGFAEELYAVRVLDPACGSGNFLYVALRQLLDLWKEVANFGFSLGLDPMRPQEEFSPWPGQMHGLEVNP